MKPGGGKRKGAMFEREVCKLLSNWISAGKDSDVFWRSAMSGGRSTVQRKKGDKADNQAGDISAISPIGHNLIDKFVVECKNYNNLEFHRLVSSNEGKLIAFWDKVVEDAQEVDKLPLLVAKQDRSPTLLCMNQRGAKLFNVMQHVLIWIPNKDLYLVAFDEFLQDVEPSALENVDTIDFRFTPD